MNNTKGETGCAPISKNVSGSQGGTSCSSDLPEPPKKVTEDFHSVVTSEEDGERKKKKKKRISKAEKEERKAKREADTLQELYKPKDSHVHLITPDLFRKLKGEDTTTTRGRKQRTSTAASAEAGPVTKASDFPCLKEASASPTWAYKSFASVISSPVPPKQGGDNSQKLLKTPESSSTNDISRTSKNTPGTSSQANQSQQTPGLLQLPPATPSSSGSSKKLSKSPLVVSLDALIVKKDKKASKVLRKNERTSALIRENVKFTVGNALDSSSPGVIHRGKIRLRPKKPSTLKRCILKSRELRKSQPIKPFVFEKSLNSSSLEPITEESEPIPVGNENVAVSDVTVEQQEKETSDKKDGEGEVAIFKEMLQKAEEEATKKDLGIPDGLVELVKLQMHNRKFRNYCDMFVTKEFHVEVVVPMLKELYRLQNRLYQTDPIKFKTKRRFVNGLKDTLSALKLNKVQMVILAPDIEPNNQKG